MSAKKTQKSTPSTKAKVLSNYKQEQLDTSNENRSPKDKTTSTTIPSTKINVKK